MHLPIIIAGFDTLILGHGPMRRFDLGLRVTLRCSQIGAHQQRTDRHIHTYIRTYVHTYIHTYIFYVHIYIYIYMCTHLSMYTSMPEVGARHDDRLLREDRLGDLAPLQSLRARGSHRVKTVLDHATLHEYTCTYHMQKDVHIYIYIYTHTYVYMCIYIYIYTYI